MTDQNAPQTAKVDGQLCAADEIADPIITHPDPGNGEHRDHDDQRWSETVIANPDHHSRAAQQASSIALIDAEGSMPLLAPRLQKQLKYLGNRHLGGLPSVFAPGTCYGFCQKVCFDEGAGSITGTPSQ